MSALIAVCPDGDQTTQSTSSGDVPTCTSGQITWVSLDDLNWLNTQVSGGDDLLAGVVGVLVIAMGWALVARMFNR